MLDAVARDFEPTTTIGSAADDERIRLVLSRFGRQLLRWVTPAAA